MLSDVEESLPVLCQLTSLQHLDLSQCTESRGQVYTLLCIIFSTVACSSGSRPCSCASWPPPCPPCSRSTSRGPTWPAAGPSASRVSSSQIYFQKQQFSWIQHFHFPRRRGRAAVRHRWAGEPDWAAAAVPGAVQDPARRQQPAAHPCHHSLGWGHSAAASLSSQLEYFCF